MKTILILVIAAVSVFSALLWGQEEVEISASGSISWILKYGLGDPRGLLQRGYSNQLLLEFPMVVNVEGGVRIDWPFSGTLSISAQLDNQKAQHLQALTIKLDTENVKGVFGDHTIGALGDVGAFATADKRLKGIKIEGSLKNIGIKAMVSRVEGIFQSKTFRGDTSKDLRTFSLHPPDRPWVEQPYLLNIRGLKFYFIEGFVKGFTEVYLAFAPDSSELLKNYELGYLKLKSKEINQATYEVVAREGQQYLILKQDTPDLLRAVIKEHIDEYNQDHNLEGEERKEYPFSEGTEWELGFLNRLAELTTIQINETSIPLTDWSCQRFYYLGQTKIESVKVEIKTEEDFVEITDPSLIGYNYHLFPEVGIIELDFPEEFFADLKQQVVRVSFDYAISGGVYVLGLAVVRGSEKVFLNERQLQRDVDYSINYENGTLVLFEEVGPDDLLRIEYQIARGGLGGFVEYQRNFSGVSISYTPLDFLWLNIDILQEADSAGRFIDPEVRVMPNTHTVVGLRGEIDLEGLQTGLEMGYNINEFPFDKRERKNLPNRINVIRSLVYRGKEYLMFGHQNGLTVFDGSKKWRSYGIAEGLAGRRVLDIAVWSDFVVFATDSGISLLTLEGDDPFDRRGNWKRFTKEDGLADNTVYSAFIGKGVLWLGTESGLSSVPLGEIDEDEDEKESWVTYNQKTNPEMISDKILEIEGHQNMLFVGTDKGLMVFDGKNFIEKQELLGLKINDIKREGENFYVATSWGIRVFQETVGTGWLELGREIEALAVFNSEIWYGTAEGLYHLGQKVLDGEITALCLHQHRSDLWVGTKASDPDYTLSVFSVDVSDPDSFSVSVEEYPSYKTSISGRDEHRFTDPDKYVDRGLLGRVFTEWEIGKFVLKGAIEGITPEFTAIGHESRQDVVSLTLGSNYFLTPDISIGAEHSLRAHKFFAGEGSLSVKDSLHLKGPQVSLGYAIECIGKGKEFDQMKLCFEIPFISLNRENLNQVKHFHTATMGKSFSLSIGELTSLISLNLGYEETVSRDPRGERITKDRNLTGEISIDFGGLLLGLSYSSPVRVYRYGDWVRVWGSDEYGFIASFLEDFPLFSLDANGELNLRMSVPGGRGSSEGKATALFKFDSFTVGDLSLSPQVEVSFQGEGHKERGGRWETEIIKLSGKGGAKGVIGDFTSTFSYQLTGAEDKISETDHLTHEISLRLEYKVKDIKPGVDFRRITEILKHPLLGKKRSERQLLTLSLGWGHDKLRGSLSLSQTLIKQEKEDTVSYSFRGVLSYDLDGLTTTVEALASYIRGHKEDKELNKWEGELNISGSWQLAEDWSATLLGGYILGVDNLNKNKDYQSIIASLQVTMLF
jgi:hypothetical protein